MARAIARANDASINIVNVVEPTATDDDRDAAREKLAATADIFDETDDVQQSVIEGDDVVDTLVGMTGEYDLTILGATREGLFQQLLFGALPEQVGQRAQNTVIMAKRSLRIRSRLKRWFSGWSG